MTSPDRWQLLQAVTIYILQQWKVIVLHLKHRQNWAWTEEVPSPFGIPVQNIQDTVLNLITLKIDFSWVRQAISSERNQFQKLRKCYLYLGSTQYWIWLLLKIDFMLIRQAISIFKIFTNERNQIHYLSTIRMAIFFIILTRYGIGKSLICFGNVLHKELVCL